MSRKWERKIERNSKLVNKQRKRFGKPPIGSKAEPVPNKDIFKGRSIILPLFLASIAMFFATVNAQLGEQNELYWITLSLYVLLAIYFFFKRPYLLVQNSKLSTRRLGREKSLHASEISHIQLMSGHCVIEVKNKRARWVFSRYINLYQTDKMAERLREFAAQHGIEIKS